MFEGLYDIDWASMHHAYGTAEEVPELLEALASDDAEEREEALSRFYGAVHHQGDVNRCTTATVPFLFELACDPAAPDPAEIIKLLVSIGTEALDRDDDIYVDDNGDDNGDESDYAQAANMMRERIEVFVAFAADADPRVRRAAIPALAQFLDEPPRVTALLRERLTAENGIMERLLIVDAMATLALRLPAAADEAIAWLDGLAADSTVDPTTRLAALAHRSRCAPERIGPDTVPAAISLLRQIAEAPTPPEVWAGPPRGKAPVTAGGAPPQVVAAFERLEELNAIYAPTTNLLRTFHTALDSRTADRAALLAEQLRSPDPGTRLDAIRMAGDLMQVWRGDHSTLITLVAGQLDAESCEVAAEAAAVLESCHPIAEPARETLAEHVAAQRAVHGSDVWAAPDERLRRAHQNAVQALARLGDSRAVPSLLAALDGDVDAWRAIGVAGDLPQAAGQLARRLIEHLRRVDIAAQRPGFDMGTRALLFALGRLGDPAAAPPITDTLATAIHHQHWGIATSALDALAALGPASTPALEHIRALTSCADAQARAAAVKALFVIGDDREAMLPLLLQNLQESVYFLAHDAAELLGQLGPAAAAAVPRLQEELLTYSDEWTRVYAAAALWDIAAEAETSVVVDTLLAAWAKNDATANFVIECLDRMGPAAAPALPQLRAELAQVRRGGRFRRGIDDDEKLQAACRALIARLG
jgi:hypothetical protein